MIFGEAGVGFGFGGVTAGDALTVASEFATVICDLVRESFIFGFIKAFPAGDFEGATIFVTVEFLGSAARNIDFTGFIIFV